MLSYVSVESHFYMELYNLATLGIIYEIIEMKMAILTITMHSLHLSTTDYLRQYFDSPSK
jgi:hypothetical protein